MLEVLPAAEPLRRTAYQTILDLATPQGINASAKNEIFGCIFGRDSAITILKILKAHQRKPVPGLLPICRRALLNLTSLAGKEFNIESGEEPGKFIHEYRFENHEHLTRHPQNPWYLYPDNIMRNYDSIDSTPLGLMALHKYWQISQDDEFLAAVLPSVEAGINWIVTFGDSDKDYLLEYQIHPERKFGGLSVQSWTDSRESLLDAKGDFPQYPIAPIEAQGYSWLALRLWANYYSYQHPKFAGKISTFADKLKKSFNEQFITRDQGLFFGAQALDGLKRQIPTVTANPLLLLWAACRNNGQMECILEDRFIPDFVGRGFMPDLFSENAGIRTMSTLSPTFNPREDSYHNGSFWTMANGIIFEGLENFGFTEEAARLKDASLKPLVHFGTPIELHNEEESRYFEYRSPFGQTGCRHQAWSAAALLDMT